MIAAAPSRRAAAWALADSGHSHGSRYHGRHDVGREVPIGIPALPRAMKAWLDGRAISADTALRLGRYFGVSPEAWMGLQAAYDLRVARRTVGAEVKWRVRPYAA